MSVYLHDPDVTIHQGDVLDVLPTLPEGSADCVVTSPPYWGLRDYGVDGQLGLEDSFDEYVDTLVRAFREVRRVLAAHGTCWVNMGDSYSSGDRNGHGTRIGAKQGTNRASALGLDNVRPPTPAGLKPKDLIGQPWALAFALRADGWYLRSCVIWHKPNPMPESVTDRPTTSHEYVFLLTKNARYFYDAEAVREPAEYGRRDWNGGENFKGGRIDKRHGGTSVTGGDAAAGRNLRSVWTIPTAPYPEAHFATFPPALVERCLKAGCPPGGTVIDPFLGSGTTAHVARRLGLRAVGIELNEAYCKLAARRLAQQSLLAGEAA